MQITGRGGMTLAEKWADGPTTFLGVHVAGFPNFFIVAGPQGYNPLTNLRCSAPPTPAPLPTWLPTWLPTDPTACKLPRFPSLLW